jgi:hypothetical protein
MADLGFTPEDYAAENPDLEVWPDNEVTLDVYMAMRTQWRMTDVGPIGLDYGSLPVVMRMVGVPRRDWTFIFEGVRLMEATELAAIRRKANKK